MFRISIHHEARFGRADAAENPSAMPAHALHVELATRITTQRLHYRSGDEETAATSIHSLFKTTRELMTEHPAAREFHDAAFALLNDALRPYTARWHGWMTHDGDKLDAENKPIRKFRDEWVRRKFREELRELQPRLLGFQKHFRALSRGEQADSRWLHVDQHAELRKQFTAECQTGPGDAGLGTGILLVMRPQITLRVAGKSGREEQSDMGEKIARSERLAILQRRVQLQEEEARANAETQLRAEAPTVTNATGLALSGGGIRSATFCLGVVQALHRRKLFAQFDYLSTVSGGGYLGSFLSSFLGADPKQLKKAEDAVKRDRQTELGAPATPRHQFRPDAPSAQALLDKLFGVSPAPPAPAGPQSAESAAVRHLRNNSRYLLSGGTVGLLRIVQVFIAGFLTSLLMLLTIPLAAAWLLLVVKVPSECLTAGVWIVAVLWLLVPLVQRCAHGAATDSRVAKLRSIAQNAALTAAVVLAVLGALHFAPKLVVAYEGAGKRIGGFVHDLLAWKPPEFLVGLLAAIVPAIFGALTRRKDGSTRTWAQALFYLTAPAFFLFAFLIFASNLGVGGRQPSDLTWPAIASGVLVVWAWFFVNINAFAPHGYYRDRLCECYLATRGPQRKPWLKQFLNHLLHGKSEPETGGSDERIGTFQRLPLSALGASGAAPYHLINATLNAEASKDPELRGRNGDFFVFSRHFCGSPLSGYITTEDLERIDPHVDLGTAMAISGAAASTNMGWQTVRRLRFLMTLFNVRLGYWLPRLGKKPWPRPIEAPGPFYLFREMLGRVHEKARFINISDGGHIENLAVYELLRRQCKFIVAVDAGMEPKMECADLMRLQRYAAIDLGIRMHFDPTDLTLLPTTYSRAYAVLVKIDYAPEQARPHAETSDQLGWMLYLKLAITGTEPRYVLDYRRQNPAFPHQTTANQFYDEAQFEAYRALGEFAAESLFREEIVGPCMPTDLRAWFQKLADSLLPDNDEAFPDGPDAFPSPDP
jgi:patatin-like phospholipase